MAEEFQESEVIFQDTVNGGTDGDITSYSGCDLPVSRRGRRKRRKTTSVNRKRSVPVSIPRNKWPRRVDNEIDGGDGGEMVPPHVIVGRRVAGKMMAFSICTGKGRVLRGRDLSEFRNLVLRMTGFLET